MSVLPGDLSSILSGIIALGANGGEHLFLPKIHAVLCKMKPHHRLLAGLWFSITGSVCYSRDVENVIRDLVTQGCLRMVDGSTVAVRDVKSLRSKLRISLPVRQYRKVLSVSRKFYSYLRTQGSSPASVLHK